MNLRRSCTGLAFAAALASCSSNPSDNGPPASDEPVTYHQQARAIIDTYCTSCHVEGGIGPRAFTDYASSKAAGAAMKAQVSAGLMPPWLPSDKGTPLRYSRALRAEDRDVLLRWIDGGMAEGDAAAPSKRPVPPLEQVTPPKPDLVLDAGFDYQPKMGPTDDYHCFPVGSAFPADTYVSAGEIVPGNPSIVHHVIVYEIKAKDVASMQAKDNAEAGPGYTCFGGPGVGSPQTLLVWAPGSVPTRAPDGLAMRVSKGSVLVMQVHYNLAKYKGVGDRSIARLERAASAPSQVALLLPVADPGNLKIPAGAADATQVINIPIGVVLNYAKLPNLTLYGNVPHMHTRGTRITTLVNGEPLVELPRWDFNWQQVYIFQAPVKLTAADVLTVECRFNNTAENQPVVNGQRLPVRDVGWGENTTDEMCLSYVMAAVPASFTGLALNPPVPQAE